MRQVYRQGEIWKFGIVVLGSPLSNWYSTYDEVTEEFSLKNEEGIDGIGSSECSNREWQELISTYMLPGIFNRYADGFHTEWLLKLSCYASSSASFA